MANLMKWVGVVLLCGGLWACGEDEHMAEGGIDGTGIHQGSINGFGSIIVNGIHFDVSQAEIEVEGQASAEEVLQPGMVVTVYGDRLDERNGRANRVIFEYSLKGVVDSIFSDKTGFIAQGQRVQVDALTVMQGASMDTLTVGSPVFVSGVAGKEGVLLARYISNQAVSDSLGQPLGSDDNGVPVTDELGSIYVELSGKPAALDTETQRFTLGQQQVDYSHTQFIDMTVVELADGLPVSVGGYLENGVVVAARVTPLRMAAQAGQAVGLEGLVSELEGNGRFRLSFQSITYNDQTLFVNGQAGDLAENLRLSVSGTVQNNGEIAVHRIEFKPAAEIRIAAPLTAINDNLLTVAGISVQIPAATLMIDSSSAALRRFSVADLAVGDAVIVYGYETASGMLSGRLERINSMAQHSLTGPVDSVNALTFNLLGVTVETSAMGETGAFYINGAPAMRSAVFTALQPGDWVTVTGTANGLNFNANKVELEE